MNTYADGFLFFNYRSDVRPQDDDEEEEEEEILGSDDDEQEDPKDYVKGTKESLKFPHSPVFKNSFCLFQVATIPLRSATYSTTVIMLFENLAGVISQLFGCAGT